jgi:hypothetical protein
MEILISSWNSAKIEKKSLFFLAFTIGLEFHLKNNEIWANSIEPVNVVYLIKRETNLSNKNINNQIYHF